MRAPETIYVERRVRDSRDALAVIAQLPDARVITIDHYRSLFHRRGQSFRLQKEHPAIILAHSDGPYIYQSPARVDNPNGTDFYTDQIRNCRFDCDYCFLQGMHASAYPVLFLNETDFHRAAAGQATAGPVRVNTSYLTDALSFEHLVPTVAGWISFAGAHPQVTVEVRTKSSTITPFLQARPLPNIRAVWTLSAPSIANRYERGCAPIHERLAAIRALSDKGWRPGIAIDPVILTERWPTDYQELLEMMEREIDPSRVAGVTYGVFRMTTRFLERIRSGRSDSRPLFHPFERHDGLATYSMQEIDAVHEAVGKPLSALFGPQAVSFVHG